MAPRPPRKIPEFTEVDYKTKAGVAWSHNYLNQKPWHPMSYPNQRRKWIAEQEHAVQEQQREVAAKEFAEEQEFFKEAALLSEKERQRIELAQAVSFMYQRPPGYNPEVDVKKPAQPDEKAEETKKPRVKDVFGRSIATGEEFEALKDAPRLETGIVGKAKPFAVEIRNVKCARCGAFGHQSGDRDCPLRDVLMPGEEERQRREDPLQAILASVPQEAPKWTLKDGGRSPPRGGFDSTAENQQILPPDEMELQMTAQADGDAAVMQPIDESVLAQLSKSERKALLRAYKKPNDKRSKEKRRRKKHRGKKSESSSSSDEDSEDSREKRKRHTKRRRKKRESDSGSEGSEESEEGGRRKQHRKKEGDEPRSFERGEKYDSFDRKERESGRKHKSSNGQERDFSGGGKVGEEDTREAHRNDTRSRHREGRTGEESKRTAREEASIVGRCGEAEHGALEGGDDGRDNEYKKESNGDHVRRGRDLDDGKSSRKRRVADGKEDRRCKIEDA